MSEFSEKAEEELKRLCEEAYRQGISIEMPTHDQINLTGRRDRVKDFILNYDLRLFQGLTREQQKLWCRKIEIDMEYEERSQWARSGRIVPGRFFYNHLWMVVPDPFADRNEGGVE